MNASRNINWRWVGESALVLLAVAVLPVIIGILLDHQFHTTPFITLAMMFLGFNTGIVAIYRRVMVIYFQISPPEQEGNPKNPGGD